MPTSSQRAFASDRFAVCFEDMLRKLDQEFLEIDPRRVERFCFDLDGVSFEVKRLAEHTEHRFLITASLGHLPFTIESADRREAIKTIVMASRCLKQVHFNIASNSKITAFGTFSIVNLIAPDFIFYPLSLFLQESRPFMQLIGQYLMPAPVPAPAVSEQGK